MCVNPLNLSIRELCRDETRVCAASTHLFQVRMPNSLEYQPVECAVVVNAAGANSGKIGDMVGLGHDPKTSMAATPVPVQPRKRSDEMLINFLLQHTIHSFNSVFVCNDVQVCLRGTLS